MSGPKPNLLIIASERARSEASSSLLRLLRDNIQVLKTYLLHTTRGTGEKLLGSGLIEDDQIALYRPGKSGGIAQLAALVARQECAAAILLLDPSDPWSDAVENRALKRVLIQLRVRMMTTYSAAQRWLTYEATDQAERSPSNGRSRWQPTNWQEGVRNVTTSQKRVEGHLAPSPSSVGNYLHLAVRGRTAALISHDRMKREMVNFANLNSEQLAQHHRILTTGTTGWLLKLLFAGPAELTGLINELQALEIDKHIARSLQALCEDFDWSPKSADFNNLLDSLRLWLKIRPNSDFVAKIMPLPSGPKGGDVLIAQEVLDNLCHSIIFFHDPLTAHPHNDDIRLLEHTSQLPGVFCECVSDSSSAEWWARGLRSELSAPGVTGHNLAQDLRQAYDLHDLILVDGRNNRDGNALGVRLADACAGFFNRRLIDILEQRDQIRVGIGWGFGPSHVLKKLKLMRDQGTLEKCDSSTSTRMIRWSPLIGTLTPVITDREASTKSQDFCKFYDFYDGEVDGFPCAGFARAAEVIPDRAMRLIEALEQADLILTSASPWDDNTRDDLYKVTGVNPMYFSSDSSAIGLVSGVTFDRNGDEVQGDYRLVGLGMDGYRRAAERGAVILICGGKRRQPVVKALLKAKAVATLVTTVQTARWLLSREAMKED